MKCCSKIETGKLGNFSFQKGYYAYVGSAMGYGGIEARLKHHLKTALKPHWHIDYFRKKADLTEIWQCKQNISREHKWACVLQNYLNASVPVRGFGSSDCNCVTHLFYFKSRPMLSSFRKAIEKLFPHDRQIERIKLPVS